MHRLKFFSHDFHILIFHVGIYYPIAYAVKARLPGAPSKIDVRFKSEKFDQVDSGSEEPKIRTNFPESWLFDTIEVGNGTEYV